MKRMFAMFAAMLVCGALAVATATPRSPAPTQAGQASSTMSGTLTTKGGQFFLTDSTTGTTVEVRAAGLQKHVGHKVTITGQVSPGSAGSPQILTASSVSRGAAVGGKAAAAGVKAGLSKAAVVGIAAGATATTVGTLYAADVLGTEEQSISQK